MIVLGIDACLGRCSVALISQEGVLASASEDMARGHVERLAPMVGEVLAEAIAPTAIDRIGVTCGPGGFTGARLGVSFARGLALSTGATAIGISTLEALATPGKTLVALDGRRGDLFVQVFADGTPLTAPESIPTDTLAAHATRHAVATIIGPDPLPPIDGVTVARLAMTRSGPDGPPRPLYLRAPDAKAAARPVLR